MKRHTQTLGTLAALGLSLPLLAGCTISQGSDANDAADAGPASNTPPAVACTAGLTACGGVCVDEQIDDDNCGGCGLSCAACSAGRCTTILTYGLGSPAALAVDAAHVYWTDSALGVVGAVPLAGGTPVTLATQQTGASQLAIDSDNVYWSTPTQLMMAKVHGGPATLLLNLPTNFPDVAQLIAAQSLVYAAGPQGFLQMSPTQPGTSLAVLSPGVTFGRLAIGDSQMFWANDMSAPGADDGSIVTDPIEGHDNLTLASGLGNCSSLVVGPHGVYWVDSTRGLILMVPPDGGPTVTLAKGQSAAGNLAIDEASVYWTNANDDTVMKVPLTGGTPVNLAHSTGGIAAMVVDATSVYWAVQPESATQTSGMVMKMTPK